MLVCLLFSVAFAEEDGVKILSYEPVKGPTSGGGEVVIKLDREMRQAPYCRFDTTVVPGSWRGDPSVIVCAIPAHDAGVVDLCVSMDRETWSDTVQFRFYDIKKATNIVVILIVIVAIVSFGLFLLQMRQCKDEQRRHRQGYEATLGDASSESEDETKPLNRRPKYPL